MQQETHESNGAQTPQEAALAAAQKRLAQAPCSYRGLVRSLEAEGFSLPNAVYAADHCGADWERQAVLCVRRCLSEHPAAASGTTDGGGLHRSAGAVWGLEKWILR